MEGLPGFFPSEKMRDEHMLVCPGPLQRLLSWWKGGSGSLVALRSGFA